jgi:hypothetical protein
MKVNLEKEKAECNFNNLLNDDENIKLKAAKYFSWLARNEYSIYRKEIFDDKLTYQRLFPFLHDKNPKIVCEIISALGCAYDRYNSDKKIVNELRKLYDTKDKNILYYTIIWTRGMENEEIYNKIFVLMEKAKSKKIIEALCTHFRKNDTEEIIKNKVQKILIKKLETVKNTDSIKIIIRTIVETITDENVINLKYYLKDQTEEIKNIVNEKIRIYISKDEQIKILKKLNIK